MARPADQTASLLLVRVEDPGSTASLDQQKLGVLRARPIDPRTLADLPGFTPLELSHHYSAVLSPDARVLATIAWPSGSTSYGGRLHLVDTIAWSDREIDVQIDQNVQSMQWSADGTRLVWIGIVGSNPTLSYQFAVYAMDLASPSAREVARLPSGYLPQDARLLGSRLAIVGAVTEKGLATDSAAIAFVDIPGSVSPLLRLDGLRLGQAGVNETGLYPYRMIVPGLGWDLPRGRLVVVDAEREIVRVVDLVRGTESGPLAIRTRGSVKAPAGGAKMISTTRKIAAVSADGRTLYVSGLREDVPAQGENPQLTTIALQRIDLGDMSETARSQGGKGLWMASDGTRLIVADDSVRLLDARDLREIARMELRDAIVAGERAGLAYVARASFDAGSSLHVVELATGRVVAMRDVARHIADVITLR